jgi:hypothetical protein
MDKRRLHREELKRLFFNLPPSITVRKEIIVEQECGHVEILSDGPDGYSSFKTNQGGDALDYAKDRMKEERYKKYKLIVK